MLTRTLVLLLISGCAPVPYWEKVPDWPPPKEVRVHLLDTMPWPVDGWATRNKDGTCDIFLRRAAPLRECVEAHERKHCEGWDHPKGRVNLECTLMRLPGQKF